MTAKKLYHTIKHLKPIQIRYRLFYIWKRKWQQWTGRKPAFSLMPSKVAPYPLLLESIPEKASFQGPLPYSFTFLNQAQSFKNEIDWNFSGNGKLWTYNLNYFDFLNQKGMGKEEGLDLIRQYILAMTGLKDGLEPYPISLRLINWIKFLYRFEVKDKLIQQSLFAQYQMLWKNPEYHLLGNHLLENAFALVFGACFFEDHSGYKKAKKLLLQELKEQILPDGGHFELSPMYHQTLLFRLLDVINLLQHQQAFKDDLNLKLTVFAQRMLGWLQAMSFKDGSIPMFNDAAPGIAPQTIELINYAQRLDIAPGTTSLSESGYRRWEGNTYTCIIDVGPIGPDYIPGHAHCDMFSFAFHAHGKPFIVDRGTSTYEKNALRQDERSTSAHNTVQIEDWEQSEIWGGFRVGRRVYPKVEQDTSNVINARYHTFQNKKITHQRTFTRLENGIEIFDIVQKTDKKTRNFNSKAYFHFYSNVALHIQDEEVITPLGKLRFEGADRIQIKSFDLVVGFNKRMDALMVVVSFKESLKTIVVSP